MNQIFFTSPPIQYMLKIDFGRKPDFFSFRLPPTEPRVLPSIEPQPPYQAGQSRLSQPASGLAAELRRATTNLGQQRHSDISFRQHVPSSAQQKQYASFSSSSASYQQHIPPPSQQKRYVSPSSLAQQTAYFSPQQSQRRVRTSICSRKSGAPESTCTFGVRSSFDSFGKSKIICTATIDTSRTFLFSIIE